jgi:glycosyltransferase involved in cell wall biosynthesis
MNGIQQALIFSTVWPEPKSSAAGVRQMQWVNFFLRQGIQVTLSSPSKVKGEQDWGTLNLPEGVSCLPLPMNQSAVKEDLKRLNPQIVMFDRFILEEQFGHLVYEACPDALVLLETQDLHFVRRARDTVKEKFLSLTPDEESGLSYRTDTALRETASMMRVDYSYLVSSYEEELLLRDFEIGPERAQWVPFFYDQPLISASYQKQFHDRDSFVWIGNFRHGPNIDGLRWFRNEIWPRLKLRMPSARLKIYGAYPSEEVMQWHKPNEGIEVKSSADSLDEVFTSARVNLAPLRYGAGVKGKILEGFRYGVPCITTKVGVEGIMPGQPGYEFPGIEANSVQAFAEACIQLYQNENQWNETRELAIPLMSEVYAADRTEPLLQGQIDYLWNEKQIGALPKWGSRVLRHELLNSHKYFSKWIEEKEKK